jgi:hypothetical protein
MNTKTKSPTYPPFKRSSKRRRGFPSETHVKKVTGSSTVINI